MRLPSTMQAVMLRGFRGESSLSLETLPLPELKPGQVLVKMAATPINPSDLVFLRNQYGIKKPLPVIPGFEGSGTVVASRAGVSGRWLVGRRVACRAPHDGHGTWAEFMATNLEEVVPLLRGVSLEQAASFTVNPLTAWAFLTIAKEGGHRAFIQTAAASALGRMINRLAQRWGMIAIHLVRRPDQAEILKQEGATLILDSSQPGWRKTMKAWSDQFKVRLAFDAVGGDVTARLSEALQPGGRILVYGVLSGLNPRMASKALIFDNKSLEGFWLMPWLDQRSWWERRRMARGVQALLATDLKTDIQARFPLERIHDAIAQYKEQRTDGKVLLTLGVPRS